MFDRHKLRDGGVQAMALVLEKKVYASEEHSGRASACRYQLRVKFEDGSTTETSYHAFATTLASARVGAIVPVRYDPADRSKIVLDRQAMIAQEKATAREVADQAIARGEQALGGSSATGSAAPVDVEPHPDTGALRIGDPERELIAHVLNQHVVEGRLTVEELEDRLEVLYGAQTRQQARPVVDGLPPLAPGAGSEHDVPVLPAWMTAPEPASARSLSTPPRASGAAVAGTAPTDSEMARAYEAWRAKVTKMKADKAAHKRAEATGDRKEAFLAFKKLAVSRAEENSARAKYDQLHKRRPDWTAGPHP